jgi:hypothetical protein
MTLDVRDDVEHRLARAARNVIRREAAGGSVASAAPDAYLEHIGHEGQLRMFGGRSRGGGTREERSLKPIADRAIIGVGQA